MSRISLRLVEREQQVHTLGSAGEAEVSGSRAGMPEQAELSCSVSHQGHASFSHQLFQPFLVAAAFSARRTED